MIPRPIYNQMCPAINVMGGLIINENLTSHALGALIGGAFFGIEWRLVGTTCDGCEAARKVVESAGGKWIVIGSDSGDIEDAIRNGIHYSTAKTAENIDASIQHWCEHYGLSITGPQAAMLTQLMTPGSAKC